jgi:hypothetical protein
MSLDHGPYATMAELLDSLNIGVCLFDETDRALLWNRTFLRLFPEHDGPIAVGEHYSVNLRRFYLARLGPDELPHIDRYIAEGLIRHRTQTQPFVFEHRGRWLRVGSLPIAPGGRIRIWTPIASPTETTLSAGPIEPPARRGRILLTEDNATNRLVAATLLRRAGHAVDDVANGQEAVDAVRRQDYDLVLMDVQMPVLDGLAATRAIRGFPGAAYRSSR